MKPEPFLHVPWLLGVELLNQETYNKGSVYLSMVQREESVVWLCSLQNPEARM